MDFSLSPEQVELRDLTRRILTDACTAEHLAAVAATPEATDLELWASLAAAGLVGIALPETAGGGGLGVLDACVVLSEVGRAGAPVPALAVMALGAPAYARAGRDDLLAGVAGGSAIVTAAVHEPVGDPWQPAASVVDGRVCGAKVCVPAGTLATRFAVTTADGLYSVEAGAPGVSVERQDTTSGIPDALVRFEAAPAERLGGRDAVDDLLRHGSVGACIMTAAACEAALALTAEYAKGRVQFERPIATFQAVSQRAGDAFIDTEAVRLTAWQAAWRLHTGRPADEAVLTAKHWAAEGGWRVLHAAQHLHGGVGVDRDYPLHRYFLLAKQLELQLGSGQPSLARLGHILAG
jgi:acyl-CoA dehydrogenase